MTNATGWRHTTAVIWTCVAAIAASLGLPGAANDAWAQQTSHSASTHHHSGANGSGHHSWHNHAFYGQVYIAGTPYYTNPWWFNRSLIFGSGWAMQPLVIPAGSLYGPGPIQQVIGTGPFAGGAQPIVGAAGPGAGGRGQAPGAGQAGAAAAPPLAPLVARASNPAGQGRAHEFIKIGDERFRRQRFNEAYQRYKDAATAAPDLSEVHFRQGLALAAMGQYAQGVRAIKRGLQIEAAWPSSKFQLDELWDRNRVAKDAIRDALAEAAIARPQDGDLMFLLGLHLFFDGQRERSQLFFDRAEVLDPGAAEHVRAFLRELAKGPPVVIPAGPRAI